jgi:hypothetical protein
MADVDADFDTVPTKDDNEWMQQRKVELKAALADAKDVPVITGVTVNFCDGELKYGLRSDVQCRYVKLAGINEAVEKRLFKRKGKIVNVSSFPGGRDTTIGQLMTKGPDRYNGKDISMELIDKGIASKIAALKGEQLEFSRGTMENCSNISENTEFIVIQTYLADKKEPDIEVLPCNRKMVKCFTRDKYESWEVELTDSKYWGTVKIYWQEDKKENEYANNYPVHSFSSLYTKPNVKLNVHKKLCTTGTGCASGGGIYVGTMNSETANAFVAIESLQKQEETRQVQKLDDKTFNERKAALIKSLLAAKTGKKMQE